MAVTQETSLGLLLGGFNTKPSVQANLDHELVRQPGSGVTDLVMKLIAERLGTSPAKLQYHHQLRGWLSIASLEEARELVEEHTQIARKQLSVMNDHSVELVDTSVRFYDGGRTLRHPRIPACTWMMDYTISLADSLGLGVTYETRPHSGVWTGTQIPHTRVTHHSLRFRQLAH